MAWQLPPAKAPITSVQALLFVCLFVLLRDTYYPQKKLRQESSAGFVSITNFVTLQNPTPVPDVHRGEPKITPGPAERATCRHQPLAPFYGAPPKLGRASMRRAHRSATTLPLRSSLTYGCGSPFGTSRATPMRNIYHVPCSGITLVPRNTVEAPLGAAMFGIFTCCTWQRA